MGFAPLDRGKSLEISLDPRDFPRASPSGNLSGLGKSWASGMDFPIHPSSWWSIDTLPYALQVLGLLPSAGQPGSGLQHLHFHRPLLFLLHGHQEQGDERSSGQEEDKPLNAQEERQAQG